MNGLPPKLKREEYPKKDKAKELYKEYFVKKYKILESKVKLKAESNNMDSYEYRDNWDMFNPIIR